LITVYKSSPPAGTRRRLKSQDHILDAAAPATALAL